MASSSCTRARSSVFSCCSSHTSSWLGRCSTACRSFSVFLRSTRQSSSAFMRQCLSRSTCGRTRQPARLAPAPGHPPAGRGHLELQVAAVRERGALLLAPAGQAQGQVVVLLLAAPELAGAGLALLPEPLHALLVLAEQPVLQPQLGRQLVPGAQPLRQLLHPPLQLQHLAHQQLRQARLPRCVCDGSAASEGPPWPVAAPPCCTPGLTAGRGATPRCWCSPLRTQAEPLTHPAARPGPTPWPTPGTGALRPGTLLRLS